MVDISSEEMRLPLVESDTETLCLVRRNEATIK